MTETPALISVIIPTRNRLPFLKEAVQSVLAQASCEVVVVDDASSDGTAEWLSEQRSERLTSITLMEHLERAAARNRGLESARGAFVLFLDDDDRLQRSALRRLHGALAQNPDAIAAAGARMLFNEQGQHRRIRHPRRTVKRIVFTDLVVGWMTGTGTVLWQTHVIRSVGGWNEKMQVGFEDRELWLRAAGRGPMVIIPDIVLENRTHVGQWKPTDSLRLREEWLRGYIDSLAPRDKALASRAFKAYWLLKDAGVAYGTFQFRKALSLYLEAYRLAPSVIMSPLLWPRILRLVAKTCLGVVVGRNVMVAARSSKRRVNPILRRMLGQDVDRGKREVPPGESP